MVKHFFSIFIFIMMPLSGLAEVQFSTDVQPKSGSLDDEFIFSVKIEGASSTDYPLLAGGDDFKLTLIGPQSSVQIINGQVSQELIYAYRLVPSKEGVLKTPSAEITLDGKKYFSPSLLVKVTQSNKPSFNKKEDLMLRQSLSSQAAYVGEQVMNYLDLYYNVDVTGASFEDLDFESFWYEKLGKDETSKRYVNSSPYTRHRVKYVLYPLSPGTFDLPRRFMKVNVRQRTRRSRRPGLLGQFDPFDQSFFDSFFMGSRIEQRRAHSNSLRLRVKALPALPPNFPNLGLVNPIVGELNATLNYAKSPIKLGESKTMELVIESSGNLHPLTKLALDVPDAKIYEEAPVISSSERAGEQRMRRVFRFSLVPTKPGTLKVPPIQLGYFDPKAEMYKIAQTKEMSFAVVGEETSQDIAIAPQERKDSDAVSEAKPTPEVYREETALERLSQQVSLSLSLLVASIVFLFIGLVFLLLRRSKLKAPLRKLIAKIESASDIDTLNNAFVSYLALRLLDNKEELDRSVLRRLLKNELADPDLVFEIEHILDLLDAVFYSQEACSPEQFKEIKKKISSLNEKIK